MTTGKRNWLVCGASALALSCFISAPSIAADFDPVPPDPQRSISGTFDLYGGWSFDDLDGRINNNSHDSDYPFLGGAGRVDLPFSENLSLQLDLEGVAAFTDGTENTGGPSESDNYAGGAVSAAHLNYREVDRFLIGLFGGAGVAAVNDTASTGKDPGLYFVGVEGQMYFGDLTLYGQVGYMDAESDTTQEELTDAFFLRAVGRFYFNGGHTKLEGEFSYANGDQDEGAGGGTDDMEVFGWGGQLTHQFHNWGNDGYIAGFLRYEGRYFDEGETGGGSGNDYDEHTFMVGVSVGLNQVNLKSMERTGVALDLPHFTRWVAGTTAVDDD